MSAQPSYTSTPRNLGAMVAESTLLTPSNVADSTPTRRIVSDLVASTPSAVKLTLTIDRLGLASTPSSPEKSDVAANQNSLENWFVRNCDLTPYLIGVAKPFSSRGQLGQFKNWRTEFTYTLGHYARAPTPEDYLTAFLESLTAKIDEQLLCQIVQTVNTAIGSRPVLEQIDDAVTVDFPGRGTLISIMLEADTCHLSSFTAFKDVSMRFDLSHPSSRDDLIASLWQQSRLSVAIS